MSAATTIDVNQLRVGMFVHLDIGWMSHPFPLSSFRIGSPEQIATIRALGVGQVRWSPDKSDFGRLDEAAPAAGAGTPAEARGATAHGDLVPSHSTFTGSVPAALETPEQAARRARRAALSAQRAAAALCERQYAEASRAWRSASELVLAEPAVARERTEALTRAMLDKMLGEREMCIRLLTETGGDRSASHALNVTIVSLLMGKLLGLSEIDMLDLGMGSLLHDIGKIELPDRVRHVDEHFTAAEMGLYRDHVTHGVSHGRRMGLAPGALLVIAQHHEQADGSGFPQRLNVDRMTAAARIVSLVNRYENLCNPLQAARALTPHEALSLMFAQGKHKFDVTMLNAFIRMMGVYPPGSVVQLTDDRYALVMTVNSVRPLKPRVLVHDPKVPRDEALLLDLEAVDGVGIRRSLKASQLPAASLEYLAPRPRVAYYFEPAPVTADQRQAQPA